MANVFWRHMFRHGIHAVQSALGNRRPPARTAFATRSCPAGDTSGVNFLDSPVDARTASHTVAAGLLSFVSSNADVVQWQNISFPS